MLVTNLTMTFNLETIFNNVNILIPDDEKIGIVGINGAGKTTFFKLILNKIEPDHGTITFTNKKRITYLPQVITDELPSTNISVLDYLLQTRPIAKLQNEINNLYLKIQDNKKDTDKILKQISRLEEELAFFEPYTAESELLKIISGMNIDDKLLDQNLNTLSGGQKSKVAFASLLYSKPDLILLDEPTNHLDLSTKEYITTYLKNYKRGVFIISHDIDFLNEVTSKTLVIDKRTSNMYLYNGNYSKYKILEKERLKNLEKEALKQEKEKKHLEGIIAKYIHGNEKKANIAKDRQKKLAKLEEKAIIIEKKNKTASLSLTAGRSSTSYPLKLKDLCFKYDKSAKKYLLYKINLEIPRGEKFLIIGENGVGKSTLLKLIVGLLSPDVGEVILGPKTDIAYYAQEHENLDNDKNLIENLSEFNLTTKEEKAVLGKFLFKNDDLVKKVSILSPGERSRLALAKLTLKKANLLILDEPTNHLDPDTQKIIAENLKTFPGTMIVVSHNTEFVDYLGIERTLILPEGRLDYYEKDKVKKYELLNKEKPIHTK